jgi:uncharacterized membrane protein YphA (DoxX/SURF4 family)
MIRTLAILTLAAVLSAVVLVAFFSFPSPGSASAELAATLVVGLIIIASLNIRRQSTF